MRVTDTPTPATATKKRSLLVPLLVVLAAAAVFAASFWFLGGMELAERLLSGSDGDQVATPVPPKPTEDPDDEDAAPPEEEAPDEDADVDEDAEEPADAAPTTPATSPTPSTPSAPSDSAVTPVTGVQVPAEARERMYWEQVDSQEQITKLVTGKITSFSFTPQSATATEARLRVSTHGDDPISGTAVLRSYDGAWFFSSITRDGNTSRGAAGRRGDTSVTNTIVNQQATSQDVIGAFVDGGYRSVKVNNVSMGSGTATLDVEFGGGTKARTAGQIVAISKDINGVKHWFLTSFREL